MPKGFGGCLAIGTAHRAGARVRRRDRDEPDHRLRRRASGRPEAVAAGGWHAAASAASSRCSGWRCSGARRWRGPGRWCPARSGCRRRSRFGAPTATAARAGSIMYRTASDAPLIASTGSPTAAFTPARSNTEADHQAAAEAVRQDLSEWRDRQGLGQSRQSVGRDAVPGGAAAWVLWADAWPFAVAPGTSRRTASRRIDPAASAASPRSRRNTRASRSAHSIWPGSSPIWSCRISRPELTRPRALPCTGMV